MKKNYALDDENPIIQSIEKWDWNPHSRKKELLDWAKKLQEANKKTNVLRSFRIENTLDTKAKHVSEISQLSYTKIINIALDDFLEKFDQLQKNAK